MKPSHSHKLLCSVRASFSFSTVCNSCSFSVALSVTVCLSGHGFTTKCAGRLFVINNMLTVLSGTFSPFSNKSHTGRNRVRNSLFSLKNGLIRILTDGSPCSIAHKPRQMPNTVRTMLTGNCLLPTNRMQGKCGKVEH